MNQLNTGSPKLPFCKIMNMIRYTRWDKTDNWHTKFLIILTFSVFKQMNRRVGDITGLDMVTAEDLQVCNYGIGGHYEPHYDFARVQQIQFQILRIQLLYTDGFSFLVDRKGKFKKISAGVIESLLGCFT